MEKKVLDVRASDNEYFHLDFHLSMNMLLEYILIKDGYEGVIEYITQFTKAYHAPLIQKLSEGRLLPLKEYLEEIYKTEKTTVEIQYNEDKLTFAINNCPAIAYIVKKNQIPSLAYIETYRTLYKVICEHSPFTYELLFFDEKTGKSTHQFKREVS